LCENVTTSEECMYAKQLFQCASSYCHRYINVNTFYIIVLYD